MTAKNFSYRMIGASGVFDVRGNSCDSLIKQASAKRGVFTLWTWTGSQWHKVETFIF